MQELKEYLNKNKHTEEIIKFTESDGKVYYLHSFVVR
jgi:hypothetical protein